MEVELEPAELCRCGRPAVRAYVWQPSSAGIRAVRCWHGNDCPGAPKAALASSGVA